MGIHLVDPPSVRRSVEHPSGPLPVTPPATPRRAPWWRAPLLFVGWAALGAGLATAWVLRDRAHDVFGPWWFLAVPFVVLTLLVRERPRPPKSAAHPALQVRRAPRWAYRPVTRPVGRGGIVPNVFVDGDSSARAAWPGADLATARRWTLDTRRTRGVTVRDRGGGARGCRRSGAPGRAHVRVASVAADGTILDALWELVAPVDPRLPILVVTDDDAAVRAAGALGAQVLACRGWMTLADRLTAGG